MGASIINRILVIGAEMALFVQDKDSYDYYGKWFEAPVRDNTLLTVAEIQDFGHSLLARWAYPDETYDITTLQSGLRAGMNVRFDNTLFGTRTRTNHVVNPSFEVNVTDGWTFTETGAGGSAAQSAVRASVGAQSCKLLSSAGGAADLWSNNVAVADGETVTVQARLYRPTDIAVRIRLYDSTTPAVRGSCLPSLTETWELLTVSWENDTGGTVDVQLNLYNTEGDGTSEAWFDACSIEIDKGPRPVEYIDGTLPYCYWVGEAHNSPSWRPPVYMVKQLTLTWPEDTARYQLTLGGKVTSTALIRSRLQGDDILRGLGPVVSGQMPLASKGWSHNLVFSATDFNTVAWGSGTITTAAGETFSIVAGNTGNMAGGTIHYIHLDIDTSLTVLQDSVDTPAVGSNIILVAVAAPVADVDTNKATFQVFGGEGTGVLVTADNIASNTITANEIAANAIEAAEIKAGAVTTVKLNALAVTAAKIAANTITANKLDMGMGGSIFNQADGLLLLSPHSEINATEWWSLRRQLATLSGAFRQVAGYWQGTKALAIERGSTNLIENPSFEVNITDFWTNVGMATYERSTAQAYAGSASLHCISDAATDYVVCDAITECDATEVWTASLRLYLVTGDFTLFLQYFDGLWKDLDSAAADTSKLHQWQTLTLTGTMPAGTIQARVVFKPTATAASEFYVDCAQVEESAYATSYLDGSLGTGYAWSGAAHNSTSTRTETIVDLDALVGLISGNNTMSFRCVAQMPYDADADWPTVTNYIYDARGADNNNRIILGYQATDDVFVVYVNGGYRITNGSVQTFDAGDWVDIVVTIDFTNDEYYMYVNGVLDGSATTVLAAAVLTDWKLGGDYNAGGQHGMACAEYAVFDRVLTATEVAALYALGKPAMDTGAMDTPGIYILDGRFKIASALTGNRVEIDADEIAGYSSAGVKQFYLQSSDGKAVAGAGAVILDADGLAIDAGELDKNSVRWMDGAVEVAHTRAWESGGTHYVHFYSLAPDATHVSYMALHAEADDGTDSILSVISKSNTADPRVEAAIAGTAEFQVRTGGVRITKGLYVGTLSGVPTEDDIICDGTIKTALNHEWDLGDVVGGTITPDTKIHIKIDGNWYTLTAEAGEI